MRARPTRSSGGYTGQAIRIEKAKFHVASMELARRQLRQSMDAERLCTVYREEAVSAPARYCCSSMGRMDPDLLSPLACVWCLYTPTPQHLGGWGSSGGGCDGAHQGTCGMKCQRAMMISFQLISSRARSRLILMLGTQGPSSPPLHLQVACDGSGGRPRRVQHCGRERRSHGAR